MWRNVNAVAVSVAVLLGGCGLVDGEPEQARASGLDMASAGSTETTASGPTEPGAGAEPVAVARWEYVAEANRTCDEAIGRAVRELEMPSHEAGMQRFLLDTITQSQAMMDELAAIPAPPGDEAVVADMWDKQRVLLDALRTFAEAGDFSARTSEAMRSRVEPLEQAADDALRAYGLTACVGD